MTYMSKNHFCKGVGKPTGPMPHGFVRGLMLLKDLLKPPIPCRTYMMKNHF